MIFINILNIFYTIKVIVYFIVFRKSYRQVETESIVGKFVDTSVAYVDIIVPMFNEEKVILYTIDALKNIDYPYFNIIAVDDGSTDKTVELLSLNFKDLKNLRVIRQSNKGKSAALNYGIENACGSVIICVDADTIVRPDLINKLLPYFDDERVAAVAGSIRVGNRNNLITDIQYTEYITNPNYERIAFNPFNGILVIPGAIGAFKREILLALGGYNNDTLTEDTELTFRILSKGYIIRNADDVFGFTEAPETLKTFFEQRIRWKAGTFQVLKKYRAETLTNPNKIFSLLIIPYSWLFGIILPIFTPIADFIFFYQAIGVKNFTVIPFYFFLIFIDLTTCMFILLKKREAVRLSTVLYQRFLLRQLIFIVYLKIFVRVLTGRLFVWEKSTRYGSARIS